MDDRVKKKDKEQEGRTTKEETMRGRHGRYSSLAS